MAGIWVFGIRDSVFGIIAGFSQRERTVYLQAGERKELLPASGTTERKRINACARYLAHSP
jgi:hypothetical protein